MKQIETKTKQMPEIKGKTHFLMLVNASDCIKDKISGRYLNLKPNLTKSEIKKMKKDLHNSAEVSFEKVDIQGDPILSKVERKKKTGELKQKLKKIWTTDDSEGEIKSGPDVPSHFKKYTIQDRTLVVQQQMRDPKKNESYDGPEDAKRIDIAEPREDPKPVYIATDLSCEEKGLLIKTLKEYKDTVYLVLHQILEVSCADKCQGPLLSSLGKTKQICPYTPSMF